MPERKAAENSIADFAKTLEAQLSAMSAEYQQGLQEYQENEANYNDLVKKDKKGNTWLTAKNSNLSTRRTTIIGC